jgi:hypothetical protein
MVEANNGTGQSPVQLYSQYSWSDMPSRDCISGLPYNVDTANPVVPYYDRPTHHGVRRFSHPAGGKSLVVYGLYPLQTDFD